MQSLHLQMSEGKVSVKQVEKQPKISDWVKTRTGDKTMNFDKPFYPNYQDPNEYMMFHRVHGKNFQFMRYMDKQVSKHVEAKNTAGTSRNTGFAPSDRKART